MSNPKFSKRHYVAIAGALRAVLVSASVDYEEGRTINGAAHADQRDGILRAAGAIAATFADDNAAFDPVRFINAVDPR